MKDVLNISLMIWLSFGTVLLITCELMDAFKVSDFSRVGRIFLPIGTVMMLITISAFAIWLFTFLIAAVALVMKSVQ